MTPPTHVSYPNEPQEVTQMIVSTQA